MENLSDHEIRDYIIDKYGCMFPIFHRIKVNGKETDEIFKFLRSQTPEFVNKR